MSNFNETSLPGGIYTGEVISQELTRSSNNHIQFELKFSNLVHAIDGAIDPEIRRTVYLYLTDKAAEYTVKKLSAAGFVGQVNQFQLTDPDAISIIGNEVALRMRTNDRGNEDWDILTKKDDTVRAIDPAEALQLGAQWSHLMPKKAKPTPPTLADSAGEVGSTFG